VKDKKTSDLDLLGTIAMIVALFGAVGSLYFMFHTGRHQKSVLLIVFFIGWVLSPFFGLFIGNKFSNRWTTPGRVSLYCLMIFQAIGSLVAYSGALTPPNSKPAFIFLVAPFTSWLFIVTVLLTNKKS
jgi:hypothetical protein